MGLAAHSKISSLFMLAASSPRINRRYQAHSGTFSLEKPTKIKTTWARYKSQKWCRLNSLNLDQVRARGVFLIWNPDKKGDVIQIGQGNIAACLQDLRNSSLITRFGEDLLVSWARVPQSYRDGVVRFLFEQYSPAIGEITHSAPLVIINLPGKS